MIGFLRDGTLLVLRDAKVPPNRLDNWTVVGFSSFQRLWMICTDWRSIYLCVTWEWLEQTHLTARLCKLLLTVPLNAEVGMGGLPSIDSSLMNFTYIQWGTVCIQFCTNTCAFDYFYDILYTVYLYIWMIIWLYTCILPVGVDVRSLQMYGEEVYAVKHMEVGPGGKVYFPPFGYFAGGKWWGAPWRYNRLQ